MADLDLHEKFWTCAPPSPVQFSSFSCSFLRIFVPSPFDVAALPSGKSWIRHWLASFHWSTTANVSFRLFTISHYDFTKTFNVHPVCDQVTTESSLVALINSASMKILWHSRWQHVVFAGIRFNYSGVQRIIVVRFCTQFAVGWYIRGIHPNFETRVRNNLKSIQWYRKMTNELFSFLKTPSFNIW